MLKQRVFTAIVLAPLALLGVFALPLSSFIYLLDLAIILAAWEWANLSGYQDTFKRYAYVAVMTILIVMLHSSYSLLPVDAILIASAIAWVVAFVWVSRYPSSGGWAQSWQRGLIGFAVLIPCWIAFVTMKAANNGELLILLLFLIVWGADIGAYFAGKRFGRNKLAPSVSPGKTREGMYGGLVAVVAVAAAFAVYSDFEPLQVVLLLVLALITGLVSVLGDLFESMLKRHRGIKDSSQLLPGHGGILDRIDSLTAASPVFVLGMQYLLIG